jgi:hypothetical protein
MSCNNSEIHEDVQTSDSSSSIAAHVKEMVEMHKELRQIDEENKLLQKRVEELSKRKKELTHDLANFSRMLEYCIEGDKDPVQLRLSNTQEEFDKIWYSFQKTKNHRELLIEDFVEIHVKKAWNGGKIL